MQWIGLLSDIEILKVGHHGSNTASSQDFISATKPEVAIYMSGSSNSYGHPHEETLIALDSIGATIYGTDVHGTIIVTTNGQTYDLQLEKPIDPVDTTIAHYHSLNLGFVWYGNLVVDIVNKGIMCF